MLKAGGALLVFFAGWGMGNWKSRQYQRRIEDLQMLQLIISCLTGEISFARNTLPEAFSRISTKVVSPFREYLQVFDPLLILSAPPVSHAPTGEKHQQSTADL